MFLIAGTEVSAGASLQVSKVAWGSSVDVRLSDPLKDTFDGNELGSLGRSAGEWKPQNQSQFPIDNATRSPPLPFSRKHYKLLCDRLYLPRATSGMLISHTATSSTPRFQIHSLATEEITASGKQSKDTVDKIGEYAASSFLHSRKLI